VSLLLNAGADINISGGYNGTALTNAACWGHESLVRQLLDAGADINTGSQHYGTPLAAAANMGHESIVRLLLNQGADVNMDCGGENGPPLQAALSTQGPRLRIVRLLLDSGADVNAIGGKYSITALQAAWHWAHEAAVDLLIERGAVEPTTPPETQDETTANTPHATSIEPLSLIPPL